MNGKAPFLLRPFPEWENRVSAAFTTRFGGGVSSGSYADLNLGYRSGDNPDNVSRNWNLVIVEAGLIGKSLVLPRLAHGDIVFDAGNFQDSILQNSIPMWRSATDEGQTVSVLISPSEADAVYTTSNQHVLAVTMADCLTALIFDPTSATIAAVHAGWRGTRAKILEKTIQHLVRANGINLAKTLVAFGPCLQRDSLEVGPEVAFSFPKEFVLENGGRFYFDMPGDNYSQALSSGIAPENIRNMGGCTLTEPERYFSYRRDGPASGRLAAFISLR